MNYTQIDHQALILAQVFGSLLMGALIGAFPLTLGFIKKQKGLAIGGFFACWIGSFLAGFFLSIPLCALFIGLIIYKSRKNDE